MKKLMIALLMMAGIITAIDEETRYNEARKYCAEQIEQKKYKDKWDITVFGNGDDVEEIEADGVRAKKSFDELAYKARVRKFKLLDSSLDLQRKLSSALRQNDYETATAILDAKKIDEKNVRTLMEQKLQSLGRLEVNQKFWAAVSSDNLNRADLFLGTSYVDVDEQDSYGYSLFHRAAEKGDVRTLQYLVDRGWNVKAQIKRSDAVKGIKRKTGLHLAAQEGRIEAVNYLIDEAKADVAACDVYKITPLHLAAQLYGNLEVCIKLLDSGAIVDALNDLGNTPLHVASLHNNYPVVVEILRRDANVLLKNQGGYTARALAKDSRVIEALHAREKEIEELQRKERIRLELEEADRKKALGNTGGLTSTNSTIPRVKDGSNSSGDGVNVSKDSGLPKDDGLDLSDGKDTVETKKSANDSGIPGTWYEWSGVGYVQRLVVSAIWGSQPK